MAVDLHIGSIETVIDAGEAGSDGRKALLAEALRLFKAEMERMEADKASRGRDTNAQPRAFGRRF